MWGEISSEVATDSVAAKGVASRRGTGRIRHLETGSLWVQAALQAGRFTLVKVPGTDNIADIGTKCVDRETLGRLLASCRLKVPSGRSALAPQTLSSSANS